MTIGFSNQPMLRPKQYTLDIQELPGVWQFRHSVLGYAIYTRVDQVCLLWGVLALLMFAAAPVSQVGWQQLALAWSGLTVMGVASMIAMVSFWARVERLMWLVYSWSVLMLLGTAVTDWGVFGSVGSVLLNLCPLWLGLCAIGHGLTGWGMRSRAFLWLAGGHGLAALIITQLGSWQYVATGVIISGSLLVLAQLRWDMRPPINYAFLSDRQQTFNRRTHNLSIRSNKTNG